MKEEIDDTTDLKFPSREEASKPLLDITDYDERRAVAADIAQDLVDKFPMSKLRKEWFIDYGTMNGWGRKTSCEFCLANAIHDIDRQKNPELHHKLPKNHNWRCWDEDNCSCGLCSSCDSSD